MKVDRLTREGYDGQWFLKFCKDNNCGLIFLQENYDITTPDGEMMFGMSLLFGQKERREIGNRTRKAMEEAIKQGKYPAKTPFGYFKNEDKKLEINPMESEIVKDVFDIYSKGNNASQTAKIMRENNRYLRNNEKWTESKITRIINNPIYKGDLLWGIYKRKKDNQLFISNHSPAIVSKELWDKCQRELDRNGHGNYGEHIHIFTSLVKCPECKNILSSNISYKYDRQNNKRDYYYLTCKNPNCKSKGLHYSCDKIEKKLGRILDELTRYMYENTMDIITSNSNKSKEIKDINKAIEKLKVQEQKLVDLYISSTLTVDMINKKNEMIKKEIQKLINKKELLDPDDIYKEYTIELLRKLDCKVENDTVIFNHKLGFSFIWNSLNRKTKKEILNKIIASLEIVRNKDYSIDISNIRFTDEFISKSTNEYLEYLNDILQNNNIGVKYRESINKEELEGLSNNYIVVYLDMITNNYYTKDKQEEYLNLISKHFYKDGIISGPYIENNILKDHVLLIPKTEV